MESSDRARIAQGLVEIAALRRAGECDAATLMQFVVCIRLYRLMRG